MYVIEAVHELISALKSEKFALRIIGLVPDWISCELQRNYLTNPRTLSEINDRSGDFCAFAVTTDSTTQFYDSGTTRHVSSDSCSIASNIARALDVLDYVPCLILFEKMKDDRFWLISLDTCNFSSRIDTTIKIITGYTQQVYKLDRQREMQGLAEDEYKRQKECLARKCIRELTRLDTQSERGESYTWHKRQLPFHQSWLDLLQTIANPFYSRRDWELDGEEKKFLRIFLDSTHPTIIRYGQNTCTHEADNHRVCNNCRRKSHQLFSRVVVKMALRSMEENGDNVDSVKDLSKHVSQKLGTTDLNIVTERLRMLGECWGQLAYYNSNGQISGRPLWKSPLFLPQKFVSIVNRLKELTEGLDWPSD